MHALLPIGQTVLVKLYTPTHTRMWKSLTAFHWSGLCEYGLFWFSFMPIDERELLLRHRRWGFFILRYKAGLDSLLPPQVAVEYPLPRNSSVVPPAKMFRASLLTCLAFASIAASAPAASSSVSAALSSMLSTIIMSSSPTASSVAPSAGIHSSAVSSAPPEFETVAPASDALNNPGWSQDTDEIVEAINGQLGATVIAPDNTELDQQNPDSLAPPTTDSGSM